jgi:hypothetical protein
MENILNFIKEEKSKLDAETERKQKEYDVKVKRLEALRDCVLEKLAPLQTLKIEGHACILESSIWANNYIDIVIKFGKPWVAQYETMERRESLKLTGKLTDCCESYFKVDGNFLYHISNKTEQLSFDDALQFVAKYLALRVK